MEPTALHLKTGQQGEALAATFLVGLGYEILERNVRLGHDEIDLVAFDPQDQVLVFCEVKTRTFNHPDFTPFLGVTTRKQQALLRASERYIAEKCWEGGYRIDLICVAGDAVTSHVKELFAD